MGRLPIGLIAVGSLLVLSSISVWVLFGGSSAPQEQQQQYELDAGTFEDTEPWDRWKKTSTQYFTSIRVFHTLNPHRVILGETPILQERGPYVYEEKRVKLDVNKNSTTGTVSYREHIEYFFRPDKSNGTEQDEVTVLNIPLALLAIKGSRMSFLAQMAHQTVIEDHEEDEKLFSNTTVGELLYGGRYVPMMKTLDDVTGTAPLTNYTFGVFFPKNGSDEGTIEVKTGVRNPNDFGRVVSWKNQTELGFWGGETCNMINGTDGSLFAPFVERDRTVYLFSPDLCRSLYLTYTQDTELKGIKGYRFGVPRAALAGPKENQANECFCLKRKAGPYYLDNCLGAGAIQLSACRNGAPIVMSTPHFFNGDQQYVNSVIGLNPDKEKHQTFVELEPTTGYILRSHKRFQLNIQIAPNVISNHYSGVPKILHPILWYDESAEMSNASAEALKKSLYKRTGGLDAVHIGKWILLIIGLLTVFAGITVALADKKQKENPRVRIQFRVLNEN